MASDKTKHIILDLDQTLISAHEAGGFDFKDSKLDILDWAVFKNDLVIVARPGLQEFLDVLFANFTVSVWTAAQEDYALFILQRFVLKNPKRKLFMFFFRTHTGYSMSIYQSPKDLRLLFTELGVTEYTLANTMIIDDNKWVQQAQPKNTIRVREFHYDRPNALMDNQLFMLRDALLNSE